MPINLQGHNMATHPYTAWKRQFMISSALSQQGFPAGLYAPIPTCSHRLQRVPFPCRHQTPPGAQLELTDYHRLIPVPRAVLQGLRGDSRGHLSLWNVLFSNASPAQPPGSMPATCCLFLPHPWEGHM